MTSSAASSDSCLSLLLYCRPGFENECAQEISAISETARIPGKPIAARDSGFVDFVFETPLAQKTAERIAGWRELIFARQCLPVFARLDGLPRTDRVTPILVPVRERGGAFNDVWIEAPDTNDGKVLAPFCKSFGNALIGALKRERLLDSSAARRLQAFFPQSDKVYLTAAEPAGVSPWPQGIPRLKFPREAPSRSTLKLEEAFFVLLDEAERSRFLRAGMTAVDLGAAPGGWTWQLVRRSIGVIAIDNGPMQRELMDSGLVSHLREDGFRFRPKKPVDWLVCDMVEQPFRVAELISRWLEQKWCRQAIFNLKLPMKKRYDETRRCLDLISRHARVRAKQLYHDREEITVFARAV